MKSDARERGRPGVMINEMNSEEREKFEDLKAEYDDLYERLKGKGDFRFATVYNKPAHFIYELIQNAEDVKAKKIKFVLTEDYLDIYHDGTPFEFKDIEGILKMGVSDKKNDRSQIGNFGIGFQSVLAVTSTPCIYSGCYNVEIEIQHWIRFSETKPVTQNREFTTLFRLPFNYEESTNGQYNKFAKAEVFEIVREELRSLESKTLLFLDQIEKICWEVPGKSGTCLRKPENISNMGTTDIKKVNLSSSQNESKYLVFKQEIEGGESSIKVAFKLDKDEKKIIPDSPHEYSKLVVFFPTGRVTYLKFVIHGPYETTPDRNDILSIKYSKQNREVTEKICELIARSLPVVKDLDYLDAGFLELMPTDSNNTDEVYQELYEKIAEELSSGEFLPELHGGYTNASNAVIALTPELTKFLGRDDLRTLFSREFWLDSSIRRELRNYLRKIGVQELEFRDFARNIDELFLQGKDDEWMINFYTRLLEQKALWSKGGISQHRLLDDKPIIRLGQKQDGKHKHIKPFDDQGNIQVCLPVETESKFDTVKRNLTENDDSLEFFKKLGMMPPNVRIEVLKYILDNYETEESYFNSAQPLNESDHVSEIGYEEQLDEFKKILESYRKTPQDAKEKYKKQLSGTYFVPAIESESSKHCLVTPTKAYLYNEDLAEFFRGESVYFFYDKDIRNYDREQTEAILKILGAKNTPRHISIEPNIILREEARSQFGGPSPGGKYTDEKREDYVYEGLENFIQGITFEKSHLIWRLLIKSFEEEELNSYDEIEKFFKGAYWWKSGGRHGVEYDARSLRILKECAWLFDEERSTKKPSEITLPKLHSSYEKKSKYAELLISVLKFDEEELLSSQEWRKRYGVTQELIEKARKIKAAEIKKANDKEETSWNPEYKPEELDPMVREIKLDVQEDQNSSVSYTSDVEESDNVVDYENQDEDEPQPAADKKYRKDIGRWGEELVYRQLKQEYQSQDLEVVWCNENKDGKKPYDFYIKRDGKRMGYIEVKSTIQDSPTSVQMQGSQWKFARRLYEQGSGGKYFLYIVSSAGNRDAELIDILSDPFGHWKAGTLQAHPVRIKLPKNIQDD